MRLAYILLGLGIVLLALCAGLLVFAWHSEIERTARPDPGAFDQPDRVRAAIAL